MDYNWKYAKIQSSSAFKVWQKWDSQTKIKFLELCKNDYSGKLRLFACWSIEEIIGTDNLENDENSSLLIAKKVAKGRIKLKKLLAAKGRYRTPYDYDNMELNKRADIQRGPDQRNIIWLRVMNKLCSINAYDTTAVIVWLLEDYVAQKKFNILRNEDITYKMMHIIIRSNHEEMETIYNAELENRFNHIFDEKQLEIFVEPNKISYDLGIGPLFGMDFRKWQKVEEWSYGAWIFCLDNGIFK